MKTPDSKPTIFEFFAANRDRFPLAKVAVDRSVSLAYYREIHGLNYGGSEAGGSVPVTGNQTAARSAHSGTVAYVFKDLVSLPSAEKIAAALAGKPRPGINSPEEGQDLALILNHVSPKNAARARVLYRQHQSRLYTTEPTIKYVDATSTFPTAGSQADAELCQKYAEATKDRFPTFGEAQIHYAADIAAARTGAAPSPALDAAMQQGREQGASSPMLWRMELRNTVSNLKQRLSDPPASVAEAAAALRPHLEAFARALCPDIHPQY
jgi:hypothetical protein